MTKCEHCGKPLKPFGDCRLNGKKDQKDWMTRKLHKKCFKDIMQLKQWKREMKELEDSENSS